jgi:mRNA-degrading endonuclease RelE of RelBE toxin-antitoxin system
MKSVAWSVPARRDLAALDPAVRRDVLADVEAYAEEPSHFDVVRLAGVDAWRLRVGSFRVIFRETASAITVLAVRHRSVVYDRIRRLK